MQLFPLKAEEISVGKPLPWALYDEKGNQILKAGYVPASLQQVKSLLDGNLQRDLDASPKKNDAPDNGAAAPATGSLSLEQIKLNIGDSIQLQMQSETDNSRYYVTLVGYLAGESVIVTTPTLDGNILMIREGQAFVVRMFSGKSAYAFTALTRKVTHSPFPHLHLSYPKEVRGIVVRSSKRTQANIICSATVEGGMAVACVARDISLGGALLAAREQIGSAGENLTLKLRVIVNEVEHLLTLPCQFRSVNVTTLAGDTAPSVQHGVSFEQLTPQDTLVITALLYQNLAKEQDEQ
ncbi:MAG TPA: flagellar brake protein [Gallionellaceae bacterium]|nr:flagellar brake protein [Gallionellaceae bacterium]